MLLTASVLLGAPALYYATLQPAWLRTTLAIVVALLAVLLLFVRPLTHAMMLWAAIALPLTLWYVTDKPRNDRDWEPEYATPAAFHVDGRTVWVHNVRNFAYRTPEDPVPAYYDARFSLDDLSAVDLVTSYWGDERIAHVFLTFGFRDGRHLAFSVETRRARGVPYSTIAGFFHHYEQFYVVADERDLIGVRTDIRHEQVYLFSVQVPPATRESLFLSYVDKVNQLANRPEWYNTVTDNCTTGVLDRARTLGSIRYSWQVLLSGYAAHHAYTLGLLDNDQSFAMLRQASLIVRLPGASITETYSHDIRATTRTPGTDPPED